MKKLLSVILAIMLIVTLLPGEFLLTASAADLTKGLTDIATVSKNAEPIELSGFYSHTDIAGGGVKLKYQSFSADASYAYSTNIGKTVGTFPGTNGFLLQFDGYKSENTISNDYTGKIAIMLVSGSCSQTDIKTGVPFIMIDTNSGKLQLCHGTSALTPGEYSLDETIITSTVLKYESIKEKPFTVEFLPYNSTYILVAVNVDGVCVSGLMTMSKLKAQTYAPTKTSSSFYAYISGMDSLGSVTNKWTINFYGYKELTSSHTVSTPNSKPNAYSDGLWDFATVAKNAYAVTNTYRTITDISGGGVALDFTNYSAKYPYGYNKNLGPDANAFKSTSGILLQFGGYNNNNTDTSVTGNGLFAISFSYTLDNEAGRVKNDVPFFLFNTNDGTLKLCHGNGSTSAGYYTDQTIITSSLLEYSNINNKAFDISILSYDTDNIIVIVNVESEAVCGLVSRSLLFSRTNSPDQDGNNLYVTIGGVDSSINITNKWSLNFYGYRPLKNGLSIPSSTISLADYAEVEKNSYSNENSSSYSEKNISGGGVALNYSYQSADLAYGYNYNIGSAIGGFPGTHGFSLHFDGYKNNNTSTTATGNGQIAIALTSTLENNYGKVRDTVPFLQIDTISGNLKLRYGTQQNYRGHEDLQTIIESDLLKDSNISNVPFTVSVLPYNDVYFLVIVNVNGTSVCGLMKQSLLYTQKRAPKQTGNFYVSIGGIDNYSNQENKWQINFYGFSNLNVIVEDTLVTASNASEVVSAINALPSTASLDAAQQILLAKAKYDSLSSTEQSNVSNAQTLTDLVKALNTLRQNEKFKPTATYLAKSPAVDNQFDNESTRTLYSSEITTGIQAKWNGASSSIDNYSTLTTQSIYGALPLNKMRVYIQAHGLVSRSPASDYWINFTSGDYSDCWDGTENATNRMISIHLSTNSKNVEVSGLGSSAIWIAGSSSILTKSNLKLKPIIIEWNKQSNGDYLCIISVANNNALAFTVSADKIASMSKFDPERVRVTIGTPNTSAKFGMNITGIYGKISTAAQNVTDQIEGLPTSITTDAEANTVAAVQNAYDALTLAQKEQVLNVKKLTAARALLRQYNGIDQNGRDKDGFYIPSNENDILFNINDGSSYVWTEESSYGGVHLDFNNATYGIGNTFEQKFVIENLTVRFDNLNYGNDGSFILGFESSSAKYQTFDFTGETTAAGIYLLIGKNNTVYSTLSANDETKMFALYPQNELLSASNLLNKEFFVKLKLETDGKITVIFKVDGTEFSYTYNQDYMDNLGQFSTENVQVVVHNSAGLDPTTTPVTKYKTLQGMSLDITGINYQECSTNQQNKIDAVIQAIDDLPDTASLSIEQDVYTVWKSYFNLQTNHLRLGVSNAKKLIALRDAIFDLQADGSKINLYNQGYIGYTDIDNSSLLPEYIPDKDVTLDSMGWPTWTKDLVITEAVPNKIGKNGTLLREDVEAYLQYLAKTGINGLWLAPVQDMGKNPTVNYTNYGPHTIDPYLTGQIAYGEAYDETKVDYEAGRQVLKDFVDLAHSYNIRIFFDMVSWGVDNSAPLLKEHPDWFTGNQVWGGAEIDNENAYVYDFYHDSVMEFITETCCDGIRWDLEPHEFGYTLVEDLHADLLANGRKVIFFSEGANERGNNGYTFEQINGVKGKGVGTQYTDSVFFNQTDIVEAIKNGNNLNGAGQYKYYSYQLSSHDFIGYTQASLASWAYEFAFSSFIPIFYTGEERNAYKKNGSCYGAQISDFNEKITDPETRAYYETVKQLLQIRWQYKDLVNSTADDHRNTNICSVNVKGSEMVKGYARYANNQGMIVVANVNFNNPADADFTIQVPIDDMGLSGYNYFTLKNLITGEVIASGTKENVEYFAQNIKHNQAGVYLITGENYSYSSAPTDASVEHINVTLDGNSATLDVYVKADVLKQLKDLNVMFNNTVVEKYTNDGEFIVFSFKAESIADVEVTLSGVWGSQTYTSKPVLVDLERINSLSGTTFTQYVTLRLADNNGDGVTDIKDLVRAKKIITGSASRTDDADVNGDGEIAVTDLTVLAKYLVSAKRGIKVNTVTFTDYDGALIDRVVVPEGFGAKTAITPSRFNYSFNGWSESTASVAQNKTVVAQYK